MSDSEFKWKWCSLCEATYIECPGCGLNTCSAGENCDRCSEAYDYMKANKSPVGDELEKLKIDARKRQEEWRRGNVGKYEVLNDIFGD